MGGGGGGAVGKKLLPYRPIHPSKNFYFKLLFGRTFSIGNRFSVAQFITYMYYCINTSVSCCVLTNTKAMY